MLRDTRIVTIDQEAMTCNVIRGHHLRKFVTQKPQGEWVQAFGAVISGIVWEDSVTCDWFMVALNTIDQS